MYKYLIRTKTANPLFWFSQEYFYFRNLKEIIKDGIVYVIDEDGVCLFCPFNFVINSFAVFDNIDFVWASSNSIDFDSNWEKNFLDEEFFYNPLDFLNLSGKKWKTFRKNINKWMDKDYDYFDISGMDNYRKEKETLILKWSEDLEEFYDADILIKFCFFGNNVKGLFYKDKLIAINIWDENKKYINFRYNIVDRENSFISEFSRYLFYIDPVILKSNKLVNDGGWLGKETLRKFKIKLNPIAIRKIYSFKRK